MKKAVVLGWIAFSATVFAAGNTFKVDLLRDSTIGGKTLKAGEYKIAMENGNAVIRLGKESISVPAREEMQDSKTPTTELVYTGDSHLQEIRLGGTRTRIVFEESAPAQTGQ